jgi:small subunit ribosomal protein S3e
MKFKDGYMISSGQPVNEYIDSAVRHVLLRQVCVLYHLCALYSVSGQAVPFSVLEFWSDKTD